MVPVLWLVVTDVKFSERAILKYIPVRTERLFQDLPPMCHEKQRQWSSCRFREPSVVESCYDRFSSAGGGHKEISGEPFGSLGFEVLKHFLLMKERHNFETRDSIRRRGSLAAVAFE